MDNVGAVLGPYYWVERLKCLLGGQEGILQKGIRTCLQQSLSPCWVIYFHLVFDILFSKYICISINEEFPYFFWKDINKVMIYRIFS